MYVFDTCSFIKLEHTYPIKHFPSVWAYFDQMISDEKIHSSYVIYKEILNGKDIILNWAKANSSIFKPVTLEIQQEAKNIVNKYPSILDYKRAKSGADPFIIAMAKTNNHILVTEETLSGNPLPKKIPDICKLLNIPCIDLLNVIKRENFVI